MRDKYISFFLFLPLLMAAIPINDAYAQNGDNNNLQVFDGVISGTNKTTQEDGAFYTIYPISAKKGQKIIVYLQAQGFKPAFNIGKIDGGKICLECATGHKYGDNTAVGIFYMRGNLPIQIRISTMRPKETGSFKLITKTVEPKKLIPTPIKLGQNVADFISADDAINTSLIDYDAILGGSVDSYYIDLKAHEPIEINFTNDPNALALKLFGLGHKAHHLEWNDKKAIFNPPHNGRYFINISNNNLGNLSIADPILNGKINYSLLINHAKPPIPKILPKIKVGDIINSTLDKNADYVFKPQIGKSYWLTAQSNETDISIWLGHESADGDFKLLQSDDDNGGGKNAKLLFKSHDGTPVNIHLLGKDGNINAARAAYSLSATEMTQSPTPKNAKPIRIGDRTQVNLKDGGARNSLGALFDIYKINLKAGDNVTIFTSDFNENNSDTYLEIGSGTPANFTPIIQDEDHGIGNNAKIKFTAPFGGEYLIRASSTNGTHEDKFYLNIIPTPTPIIAPPPVAITIATEINGELNALSPVYGDDEVPYNDYVFDGKKGKKYKLMLKSFGFYANIMTHLQDASDDKFVQSADNTYISPPIVKGIRENALEYTPPVDGKILVRITSSVDNQIGRFTLSINEMVGE